MLQVGTDVISIGCDTSLEEVYEKTQGKTAIQGNLDPKLLLEATPQEIKFKTDAMLETMKGKPGYIANLGHGVFPKVPVDNVVAFVETVKNSC